ncbi:hypothetical protein [Oscillatoria sp. HE19RPO]|nr:hypothetical protein [Oscillatoria sp. HE19RPO]
MDLNLSGYFHAQGEDGEKTIIYRVIDNQVYQEESRILMGIQ